MYPEPGETTEVEIRPEGQEQVSYSDELTIPPDPPGLPITLNSKFTDLNQTRMGRILYRIVTGMAEGEMRAALKLPEGPERIIGSNARSSCAE